MLGNVGKMRDIHSLYRPQHSRDCCNRRCGRHLMQVEAQWRRWGQPGGF